MTLPDRTELTQALRETVTGCAFKVYPDFAYPVSVSGDRLAALYERELGGYESAILSYGYATTTISDGASVVTEISDQTAFDAFVTTLRPVLEDYVNEDGLIGDGLSRMDRLFPDYRTVESFAKRLVRGAATLGCDAVLDMLSDWIDGEPLRYKKAIVFHNWASKDQAELSLPGLKVGRIPNPARVTQPVFHGLSMDDRSQLLGKLFIMFDVEARALFRSCSRLPAWDTGVERLTAEESVLPGITRVHPYHLSEALSLAFNTGVKWMWKWNGGFGALRQLCITRQQSAPQERGWQSSN